MPLHVSIYTIIFRWLHKCTTIIIELFLTKMDPYWQTVITCRYFRLNLGMHRVNILGYIKKLEIKN
jgi:hypothetical protein